MIAFPIAALPQPAAAGLAGYQAQVLAPATYADQVDAGKALFKTHNTKTDAVFKVVRNTLHQLGGPTRRCAYCEDSMADEVEHIAPKDLYPDQVFVWENYVYACGPCNGGHKKANWKIFPAAGGAAIDITRKPRVPVTPPPAGTPLFINPRTENPFDFLQLDLVGGTAFFAPRPTLNSTDADRAKYTRDLLGLNARAGLPEGRRHAYVHLKSALVNYDQAKTAGVPATAQEQIQRVDAITAARHRTVWLEIIRQRQALGLDAIFTRCPEALGW